MNALYAFKIGPLVPPEGGVISSYFAFNDDESFCESSSTDDEGLRLLQEASGNRVRQCEPRLAQAARRLGIQVAPLSDLMAYRRAFATLQILNAPTLDPIDDLECFEQLCVATQKFSTTSPWSGTRIFSGQASGSVGIHLEGLLQAETAQSDAAVMLYSEQGTLAKILRNIEVGDVASTARLDSLQIALLREPRWAVEALSHVFGEMRIPKVTRVRACHRAPLTDEDLLLLSATLLALSSDGKRGRAQAQDKVVEVVID